MKMYSPLKTMDFYANAKKDGERLEQQLCRILKDLSDWLSDRVVDEAMTMDISRRVCKLICEVQEYAFGNSKLDELLNIERKLYEANAADTCIIIKSLDCERLETIIQDIIDEKMRNVASTVSGDEWETELASVNNIVKKELMEIWNTENNPYKKEIEYIKHENRLMLYPYEYEKDYMSRDVEVLYDENADLKYVLHAGKRLYFPVRSDSRIKNDYRQLLMEQDVRCSHRYFDDSVCVKEGDIFVDVGSAEGIVSLDVIERASEVYLVECSSSWGRALKATFASYSEKVHIVPKYAGEYDDDNTIKLDSLLKEYKGKNIVIKMDVEGMELAALRGAKYTLRNNKCKLACTTYHTDDAANRIADFFKKNSYDYCFSDGFMLFIYGYMVMKNGKYSRLKPPYFRKAVIRAQNLEDSFGE